jgi:hypothetical protein
LFLPSRRSANALKGEPLPELAVAHSPPLVRRSAIASHFQVSLA